MKTIVSICWEAGKSPPTPGSFLYEKKLCTYPRTDSRFLTDDMEHTVPDLVSSAAAICDMDIPKEICASQVCNSKKVAGHHALVPTRSAAGKDLEDLPLGERQILRLMSQGLLRAVCQPYRYAETVVTAECAGHSFTAKGKVMLDMGWKSGTFLLLQTVGREEGRSGTQAGNTAAVQQERCGGCGAMVRDALCRCQKNCGIESGGESQS